MLWENNAEFWEISEHEGPLSEEMIKEFISNSQDLIKNEQLRLIIHNEEGDAIGALDIFDYDAYLKSGGIGIMIAEKKNRNCGYAHDALSAFLEFQIKKNEIILYRALIHIDNEPSLSLFIKNGFRKTGTKYFKGKEASQFIYGI